MSPHEDTPYLSELRVGGFKSIEQTASLPIEDLNVLCGANSSGKSSFMQAIMLLKQTAEAKFDPAGPLLLDGHLVRFTDVGQMVPRAADKQIDDWEMTVGLTFGKATPLDITFATAKGLSPLRLKKTRFVSRDQGEILIRPDANFKDVADLLDASDLSHLQRGGAPGPPSVAVISKGWSSEVVFSQGTSSIVTEFDELDSADDFLRWLFYLPGLRDTPERDSPLTNVHGRIHGAFHQYSPSIIAGWCLQDNAPRLSSLNEDLRTLKLTSSVVARRVNDARVEVSVGRAPNHPDEMVSIADVGIGTSQVLPVLVALHAAAPGQFVYVEQPELHLHPRAQAALAGVLVSAVNRGVRLIIETHSPALLQALQIQIAEGKLDPERARFHWFQRDEEGTTRVNTVTPGSDGAYGDWPEDFSEIDAKLDDDYLDATLFKGMKDAG